MAYPYPGNIRELENTIERAIVLEKGNILLQESLPDKILKYGKKQDDLINNSDKENLDKAVENLEREMIKMALSKKRTKTAVMANVAIVTR